MRDWRVKRLIRANLKFEKLVHQAYFTTNLNRYFRKREIIHLSFGKQTDKMQILIRRIKKINGKD